MAKLLTPILAGPQADWTALYTLIRDSFAYMDGRIEPPSSMHRLTPQVLADHEGEVWYLPGPIACFVLTETPGALYLGKLAVRADQRGRKLARLLVEHAAHRAVAMGKPVLQLQVRVELTENHAAFAAMGFRKIGETAHPGYDRPTSITMQRTVP